MNEARMRNYYGSPINPAELRDYLDRTQNLLIGISGIVDLMFKEDAACLRRTEEGRQLPVPLDSWLDPACRAILTVIQAAIDERESGLAGNFRAVRPVTAEEARPPEPPQKGRKAA